MTSFYKHHIFFCTNRREDGDRPCCAHRNSEALQAHAKARVKALGLAGEGRIRVNKSGCLDRCEHGPVVVVYPDAVWYTVIDEKDVDENIDAHLVGGRPVDRLRLE